MAISQLPDGWVWSTLGEFRIDNSRSIDPSKTPDQRFELYSIPACEQQRPEFPLGKEIGSTKRLVEIDTVLISKINPHLNRVWIVSGHTPLPKIASTEWIQFASHALVLPEYLRYFLIQNTIRDLLSQNVSGVGGSLMRARPAVLDTFPFPLAPLPIQQQIVDRLDAHFSRLDAAEAALRRVQANLKRYRAAVLQAACSGQLVATEAAVARAEGRSYEPAAVLLARVLAERRTAWQKANPGKSYKEPRAPATEGLAVLPEGWVWATVEQVGELKLGRQRSPKDHAGPHMRPYLRVANVYEDYIDTSDILEMNFTPQEYETFQLLPGDVLLNEGQSPQYLGRPAIYRNEVPGACFQNTLIRFRATSAVLPEFALSMFRDFMHSGRFMRLSQITTNIAHLSIGRFAPVEFALPPLAEQVRIVEEVQRRMDLAEAMLATCSMAVKKQAVLRQAVLGEAFFSLQLVEQS